MQPLVRVVFERLFSLAGRPPRQKGSGCVVALGVVLLIMACQTQGENRVATPQHGQHHAAQDAAPSSEGSREDHSTEHDHSTEQHSPQGNLGEGAGSLAEQGWSQPAAWGPRASGELVLDGYLPAQLWVPSGASGQPLRLMVIAHGAGGRGVDHCRYWDRGMALDVVLLCLTGKPLRTSEPEGGAFFPDHFALRAELSAALTALGKHALAPRLSEHRAFLGYSQGATMGALALVSEIPFARIVLIEGGGEYFTDARSQALATFGVRTVLLSCGTTSCEAHAERSVRALRAAGVSVETAHVPGAGHLYWGDVGQSVLRALAAWGYARSDL